MSSECIEALKQAAEALEAAMSRDGRFCEWEKKAKKSLAVINEILGEPKCK